MGIINTTSDGSSRVCSEPCMCSLRCRKRSFRGPGRRVVSHSPPPFRSKAGIFSAHQMGSCRLSATREDGPLRETGEAWECDGLFVADASTFPTSLGINPMITVEAVAYMIAEQVEPRFFYLPIPLS